MTARDRIAQDFYIDDHAALYGFLAKHADYGQKGLEATRKAVIAYGRERGLRSAMRCLADERELSPQNYFLYGEWVDTRQWSCSQVDTTSPTYRTKMLTCGWCESWKKFDLVEYGKIYCSWIDDNLLYGFNPELRLEMGAYLSHGDPACVFDWVDCSFADQAELDAIARARNEIAPRVTKDFLYHCGHVLSTFRREFYLEFGLVRGREIVSHALAEYEKNFGPEKTTAVVAEATQDFLTV